MYGGLSPASGESMLTGSPHSPVTPNGPSFSSSPPKTPFLPPYLLGVGQQQSAETNRRKTQQQHHQAGGYLNSAILSPTASQHRHVTWSPDLVERIQPMCPIAANVNRYGGPPVRTLDMIAADTSSHHHLSNTIPTMDRFDDSCLMMNGSAALPASQMDPFHTQREDLNPGSDLDDAWVTVFGFPADSANYILKEFSAYGPIVEHEFANKGNWVHIRYQSPMHARRALSKNGHLYAQNTIRIGVTPCIDKDVMRRYQGRRKNVFNADDGDEDALDAVGRKRMKPSSASTSRIMPPTSDIVASPRSTANNRLLFSKFDTSTPVRSGPLPALLRFDHNASTSAAGSPASAAGDFTPTTTRRATARVGNMRSLAAAYEKPQQHLANGNVGEHSTMNGANGNLLTKTWKYLFSS